MKQSSITQSALRYWCSALLFIGAWLWLTSVPAFAAGSVKFTSGEATITAADGKTRAVSEGGRVLEGETITTGKDGEVQLLMDDSAAIAIRANSAMKLEVYVAEGDKNKDNVVLGLLRGAMRSVTGFVAKRDPKKYTVRTSIATVGVRGTDHETVLVDGEAGTPSGMYNRVISGETVIRNPLGDFIVRQGSGGFAPTGAASAPQSAPFNLPVFKPSRNELKFENLKKGAEEAATDVLNTKLRAAGKVTELPVCVGDKSPEASLENFLRTYESGNLNALKGYMDPSMIGYQRYVDAATQDFNKLKQLRVDVRDVQVQCGPDVSVVNLTWEKRFLDLVTFQPGLYTGRTSILMHRKGNLWQLAALQGDSLIGVQAGTLGTLSFGPALDVTSLIQSSVVTASAATTLPVRLEVIDADQEGKRSIDVEITTSDGDREVFAIPERSPGRFVRESFPFSAGRATRGNGTLEVAAQTILTASYVDNLPGQGRPPVTLNQRLSVSGSPLIEDTTPDRFDFAPVTGAALNTPTRSNAVTITGINRPSPVSVSGCQYSIENGPATSTSGTINNGQRVVLVLISAATPSAETRCTLTVGGVAGTFVVTTIVGDTTPDPLTFLPVTGAELDSEVNSAPVTVNGINVDTPVSVTGGTVSVAGSAFSDRGTVRNGQAIIARLRSASAPSTPRTANVTVGTVTAPFVVTTRADAAGRIDPIVFNPRNDVLPNEFVYSNFAALTGFTGELPITVDGGTAFVSGATVNANTRVRPGERIQLALRSSGVPGGVVQGSVTVGNQTGTFVITTTARAVDVDRNPNPFVFNAVRDAPPATTVTSNTVQVLGINTRVQASVVGGDLIINGGKRLAKSSGTGRSKVSTGDIENGDLLAVSLTSAANPGGIATATVNVGDYTTSFEVTTAGGTGIDRDPNPFNFAPVTGAPLNQRIASAPITPIGYDSASPISISGGEYSINSGAFSSAAGTISPGQSVTVRVFSASTVNTTTSTTLTIGAISGTFAVTTGSSNVDISPAPCVFQVLTNQTAGATVRSSRCVLIDFNTPFSSNNTNPLAVAQLSVTSNPALSNVSILLNGNAYNPTQLVSPNDVVELTATLSGSVAAPISGTVLVTLSAPGSVTSPWQIGVGSSVTGPAPFSFAPVANAALNQLFNSVGTTVSGLSGPAPISISAGGEYSINGGPFTSAAGTVNSGQSVQLRNRSANAPATVVTTTLSINGVSAAWTITTAPPRSNPDPFSIAPRVNQPFNTLVESDVLNITGFNVPVGISVTGGGGEYSINGGAYTTAAGTLQPGQTVRVRVRSATTGAVTVSTQLTVGGFGANYNVTTEPTDQLPDPCFFAPLTGQTPGATVTSNECVLAGFNTAFGYSSASGYLDVSSTVSVGAPLSGGVQILLNGAPYSLAAMPVSPGDRVALRMTLTSANTPSPTPVPFGATVTASLSKLGQGASPGGPLGSWQVSTRAQDTTPDPFGPFTGNRCGTGSTAPPVTSETFTMNGFDGPLNLTMNYLGTTFSATNIGQFFVLVNGVNVGSVNPTGITFTTPVNPGQTLQFQWTRPFTAPATPTTPVTAVTIQLGTYSTNLQIRCPFP